jgi:hypothetical protein
MGHTFHALWYGLGSYGPQDVHVHPCSKDGHGPNDEGPKAGCTEVLLGYDRHHCTARIDEHERANLEDRASMDRAVARLRPAKPPEPVYCFCARVFPDCEPAASEMQDQNSLWVPLCERCMQIAFAAGVRVRKLQPGAAIHGW